MISVTLRMRNINMIGDALPEHGSWVHCNICMIRWNLLIPPISSLVELSENMCRVVLIIHRNLLVLAQWSIHQQKLEVFMNIWSRLEAPWNEFYRRHIRNLLTSLSERSIIVQVQFIQGNHVGFVPSTEHNISIKTKLPVPQIYIFSWWSFPGFNLCCSFKTVTVRETGF